MRAAISPEVHFKQFVEIGNDRASKATRPAKDIAAGASIALTRRTYVFRNLTTQGRNLAFKLQHDEIFPSLAIRTRASHPDFKAHTHD